ncbi:MAG: helix-turn-helix domain-containing protein [Caulobacterales bacterium]
MDLDMDTHVGSRIRQRRRLVGLTQKDVGDAVGVGFQQVQKYECGQNRISAARLWAVAAVLGVPIEYFFEGLEASPHYVEGNGGRKP